MFFLINPWGPDIEVPVLSDLGCSFFGQTQLVWVCIYIYIRERERVLNYIRLCRDNAQTRTRKERTREIGLACFYVCFLPS